MNEYNATVTYKLNRQNVEELLQPERGVTVISPQGDITGLLATLCAHVPMSTFTDSLASTSTGVVQNFKAFGDFETNGMWRKLGGQISESLHKDFEHLGYKQLFKTPLSLDDLTLQYYPQSKPGEQYALSPHRDQSGFINLVVVLLVYGPSTFFICKDRDGTTPIDPLEIDSIPGDLVIMRAGSFGDGSLKRPCHFVGRVEDSKGRLTFALRQITDDKTRIQKLECFFGRKFGSQTEY